MPTEIATNDNHRIFKAQIVGNGSAKKNTARTQPQETALMSSQPLTQGTASMLPADLRCSARWDAAPKAGFKNAGPT